MPLGVGDDAAAFKVGFIFQRVGEQPFGSRPEFRKSSITTWFGGGSAAAGGGPGGWIKTGGRVCSATSELDMNEQADVPPSIGNWTRNAAR